MIKVPFRFLTYFLSAIVIAVFCAFLPIASHLFSSYEAYGAEPIGISKQPLPNVAGGNDFKVVGYYPSWAPNETDKIQYDVLTHIIYAFAIPTPEGTLRPLENPDTVRAIIKTAHENNVYVLLAVGGWSYNNIPLESTFVAATSTPQKRASLIQDLLRLCDEYGFDGIDMDWEHPRVDGTSGKQYEALMLSLSDELHKKGKLLTAAVLSGVSVEGQIYRDSAAHSDAVLSSLDWIHVMAYDGGDEERHSSYEYALNSAHYWKDTRKLPPEKVVLGMPFYGRPGFITYENIIKTNPAIWQADSVVINGINSWYNGVVTIQAKTLYAMENLGGVMVWEITQDTSDRSKSLMSAIGNTMNANAQILDKISYDEHKMK